MMKCSPFKMGASEKLAGNSNFLRSEKLVVVTPAGLRGSLHGVHMPEDKLHSSVKV